MYLSAMRFFIFIFVGIASHLAAYDLTIIGPVIHSDGLGKISFGIIDLLKNDIKINCIPTSADMKDLSDDVKAIVQNPDKTGGRVSLFTAPLWYKWHPDVYKGVPKESKIKIAYSMLEGTSIPSEWSQILNEHFDAVVVPDSFLVDVYKTAGVNIPIFVIPLGMHLDDFYQSKPREHPSSPLVFGSTVSCEERKNYRLLIESFAEEFGNSEKVVLKLNAHRGAPDDYRNQIKALGVSNINFHFGSLDKAKYIDFLSSLDCFVNIAKGEGYSLCPREALALGIPCILTKNSGQITLCNSGLVREVASTIPEPATYYGIFGNKAVGNFLTCKKDDVKAALRDVYTNYESYKQKAKAGPNWVSQYSWGKLKGKYLNLIKPSDVRLGNENVITEEYLMTNSKSLYDKYLKDR